MNNLLSGIDWLIVVVYLAGVIWFGIRMGRGQKTTRDYFLGNRNIPWWGVALSIIATETSALTFIGVPALAYGSDLTFVQIVFGYVMARILLALYFVPHYFKGDIYSPYQLFGDAFGEPARRTAGFIFLVAGILAAGVRVYITCIPIKLMLGVGIGWAILLFIVLSLIYTYLGGIRAVIWTDVMQFLLFTAGGIFTLLYVPSLLEGGWSRVVEEAGQAGKLHWLNADFSLEMPYNLWMGLIGATVFAMSTHGADQLIVQRVLTCQSISEGRKSLVLSAVIILPLFLVFLLVGIMLWVFYQQQDPALSIPTTQAGFSKNDYLFPIFILTEMPIGVKGILVVAVLSAAMSSVSSALSALASVSTMDFLRVWWKKDRGEDFYFRASRYATLLWAFFLVLVAWMSRGSESVMTLALSLTGLTNGAMLGGLILVLRWGSGRAAPLVTGMLVSLISMVLLHFLPQAAESDWWQEHAGVTMAWPWHMLIGAAITTYQDYVGITVAWPWYVLIGAAITIGIAYTLRTVMGETKLKTE